MTDQPRAYTEGEVRDMIIFHIAQMVRHWSDLPGEGRTIHDRCEGVAFSIMAMLDGVSNGIPAIALTLDPHPDDKEYAISEGENWFEPGMEINGPFHELPLSETDPTPADSGRGA